MTELNEDQMNALAGFSMRTYRYNEGQCCRNCRFICNDNEATETKIGCIFGNPYTGRKESNVTPASICDLFSPRKPKDGNV